MRNAWLDEAQAEIKIARWNINNLRCVDDTTLTAESEEELKSLLMKVKEESKKAGLKCNIQKRKIMASSPITSWEIDGETMETVRDFIFGGLQNHCRWWLLSHFSRVRLCVTPQTAAYQAPPSLGFSRQEHWSGLPFPSPMHESEKWKWSRSFVSDSSRPHGLQPTRLLHSWEFPVKSTGVGCHCLLR